MLEAKPEIEIVVRNEKFLLLAERAALFRSEGALLCSDLHWGREPYLQSQGFAVPESTFESESGALSALVRRTGAREVWVLGDFIHHPRGIQGSFREKIRRWVDSLGGTKVVLIPGNHDRGAREWALDCGIALASDGIRRGEFEFRHEGETGKGFTWYGHAHPAVRIRELFGNRKLPCFLLRANEAYLPAYSRLAGGAEVGRLRRGDRVYPIHEDRLFEYGPPEAGSPASP